MSVCLSVCLCSFVTPTSFVFGDEDTTPVDCYNERFNYTYRVNISLVLRFKSIKYQLCSAPSWRDQVDFESEPAVTQTQTQSARMLEEKASANVSTDGLFPQKVPTVNFCVRNAERNFASCSV